MRCRFCSTFNCRRLTSSFPPPAMSPAHHRYRFPIPSHPTVLPVSIVDVLFSVSSVFSFFPCPPFVFISLRIAFFSTPLFSMLSALPYVFAKSIPKKENHHDPLGL